MRNGFRTNLLLLVICLSIYTANIWFKKQGCSYAFPFVRNHLNDMLATQAFLSYAGCLLSFVGKRSIKKLRHILLVSSACSFVWEYCAKYLYPRSTFDYIDILCYFMGGLIYWIYANLFIKENDDGKDS